MANESVKGVLQAGTGHYVDSDPYEATYSALSASLAVHSVITDATIGESAGVWGDRVVDDLCTAQRVLLHAAKSSLEVLRLDNWRAHAMLGEYGPEAKARAEAEKAAEAQS